MAMRLPDLNDAARFAGMAVLLALMVPGPAHAGVSAIETDGDGTARLELRAVGPVGASPEVTVVVDPDRALQRWDGVGAALTDSAATVLAAMPSGARAALLRQVFDPRRGGFNLVRLTVGASDFSASGEYTYEDRQGAFDLSHDLSTIVPVLHEAQAIQPALSLLAAPWSPPAWMKASGRLDGGEIAPEAYPALADYLVRFARQYREWGLPIAALSPQNEPLLSRGDYPTATLSASGEARLVHDFLAPALRRAGLGGVGILGLDHNWADLPYARALANSPAAADLSGYAFHCYRGDPSDMDALIPLLRTSQTMLTTECSPTRGGGFATGFRYTMRTLVMGTVLNGGSGVVMWNLALDPSGGPRIGGCGNCLGVVTVGPGGGATYDPSFYALAQVGGSVRPGARVVTARSSDPDVLAIAFRNPDGGLVVVVYNAGSANRRIGLALGGRSFGYALPANAAVTFKGSVGE
jgi:glucosylceramidase